MKIVAYAILNPEDCKLSLLYRNVKIMVDRYIKVIRIFAALSLHFF